MGRRDYGFHFDGEPVFTYVQEAAPRPSDSRLEEDFFVYVMGPYTAFDATIAYSDGDKLASQFIDDPLFDEDRHMIANNRNNFEAALAEVCDTLRTKFGVRAFLATDVDIPTESEAGDEEPAMSVLDQSVAFAAVSDAVIFVLTEGGRTTGTGSEIGAILCEFHLRERNPEPIRKPRERFRVFTTPDFSSASIDESPATFGIDHIEFTTRDGLIGKIHQFLVNLERNDPDRVLPIFRPYFSE
jgi:hypothetical protein